MAYIDLTPQAMSAVCVILFFEVVAWLFLLAYCIRFKVKAVYIVLYVLGTIVAFIWLSMLLSVYAAISGHGDFSGIEPLKNIPLSAVIVILVLLGISLTVGFIHFAYHRRTHLSLMSIKESVDKLPVGLCFYDGKGMSLLYNKIANDISLSLFGNEIMNGEEFWENVLTLKIPESCKVIAEGDTPIILTESGKAYAFKRTEHNFDKHKIYEITATDVTREYRLSTEISDVNAELKKMNERLIEYGDNINRLIREKEILNAKINIHDEMGKLLLATKNRIKNDKGLNSWELIKLWQNTVKAFGYLKDEKVEDGLTDLKKAAESIGICVVINGDMPSCDEPAYTICLKALHVSITNTASHADGDKITVDILTSGSAYEIAISNNGKPPTGNIKEGGGLSSLRMLVERANGEMQFVYSPKFLLKIKLPILKGGVYDKKI
ncbi:MAG: hypothetical protein ACI4QU_02275 [Christensenellales bacterium]